MIKANEIRLGNYFTTDDGSAILECFGVTPKDEREGFNFWYGSELGFYLDETELEPIPLTEEWLGRFSVHPSKCHDGLYLGYDEKFDWEVDNYNGLIPYKIDGINLALNSEDNLFYLFNYTSYYGGSGQSGIDKCYRGIKYVHELQNLFHSLTNEELTLKD